jgi:hypothetical protein
MLLRPIPLILRRRLKHIKVFLSPRSNLQYTREVSTSVTVIRGGPDGREFVIVEDGETFHAELVSAEDVDHVVGGEEFSDDLGTEGVAGSSASKKGASVAFSHRPGCSLPLFGVEREGRRRKTTRERTEVRSKTPPCPDLDRSIRDLPSVLRGGFLRAGTRGV